MGCDIHLAVEVRGKSGWERRLPPPCARDPWLVKQAEGDDEWSKKWAAKRVLVTWYDDRNYDAFAILANVRNGRGFAGCDTGDGFRPIVMPRGLPHDLSGEVARLDYEHPEHDADSADVDLGEHSKSWVTLKELLDVDWKAATKHRGCVPLNVYRPWAAKGKSGDPETYCGGVSGPGIRVVEEGETDGLVDETPAANHFAKVYVKAAWEVNYADCAGDLYSRLIPALEALRDRENVTSDMVRIVFGFDS
jgi:hypothetical protein